MGLRPAIGEIPPGPHCGAWAGKFSGGGTGSLCQARPTQQEALHVLMTSPRAQTLRGLPCLLPEPMAKTLQGRPPTLGKRKPTRVSMAATQGRLELLLVAQDLQLRGAV